MSQNRGQQRGIARDKFQDPEMRRNAQKLLATGNAKIEEYNPKEKPDKRHGNRAFWGVGANGDGHNWNGKILMQLRDALRAEGGAE